MKKSLIIFVFLGVFITKKSNAQTILSFYNNTDKTIYSAYAAYMGNVRGWESVGWYKIAPYQEVTVDLGDYHGSAYIHGHFENNAKASNWGHGHTFVIQEHIKFRIRNSDLVNGSRADFSELKVTTGKNSFTFNP